MAAHFPHQPLPPFAFGRPISHADKNAFADYFSLYAFAALDDMYSQYSFGSIHSGKYDLACHHWSPLPGLDAPGATVVIVHGLFDHMGLYIPLVQRLLEHRYGVVAFDLPEHGLSSGKFGNVTQFDDYVSAFRAVLDRYHAYSAIPLMCVAQSTGGAAVLQHIFERPEDHTLKKVVLLAPLIRPRGYWGVRFLYSILSPFIKHVKRTFTENSHNPSFCRFLQHEDPLQPRTLAVNWVGAMLAWERRFTHYKPSSFPISVIQGTGDMTVDYQHNLRLLAQKFDHLNIDQIPGARHHLVGESTQYREVVFEHMLSFLEE